VSKGTWVLTLPRDTLSESPSCPMSAHGLLFLYSNLLPPVSGFAVPFTWPGKTLQSAQSHQSALQAELNSITHRKTFLTAETVNLLLPHYPLWVGSDPASCGQRLTLHVLGSARPPACGTRVDTTDRLEPTHQLGWNGVGGGRSPGLVGEAHEEVLCLLHGSGLTTEGHRPSWVLQPVQAEGEHSEAGLVWFCLICVQWSTHSIPGNSASHKSKDKENPEITKRLFLVTQQHFSNKAVFSPASDLSPGCQKAPQGPPRTGTASALQNDCTPSDWKTGIL
jgi:hypothetical protein